MFGRFEPVSIKQPREGFLLTTGSGVAKRAVARAMHGARSCRCYVFFSKDMAM